MREGLGPSRIFIAIAKEKDMNNKSKNNDVLC